MNGYVAFYNGQRLEVYANDLWSAKQQVIEKLKVPKTKQHMVSVLLAEKDDQPITHTPDF